MVLIENSGSLNTNLWNNILVYLHGFIAFFLHTFYMQVTVTKNRMPTSVELELKSGLQHRKGTEETPVAIDNR